MPLVWSYQRTSASRQATEEKTGLDRQEQALQAWLAEHSDWQLAEQLVDAGVSAGSGRHRKRGALGKFIAAAEAGHIPKGSALLIESVSRFTREASTDALMSLLGDVLQPGYAIAFTGFDSGKLITAKRWNKEPGLKYGLIAALDAARVEWEERSKRATGARRIARERQDKGERSNHRVPFWILTTDEGKAIRDEAGAFQLDPVHQATILRAYELMEQGYGAHSAANVLNEEGRPPRTKRTSKNRGWTGPDLDKLLKDPGIKGDLYRPSTGETIQAYYPAVIDAARFEGLKAIRAKRIFGRSKLKGRSHKANNLAQGISYCANCGSPMGYTKSGRYSANNKAYLRCRKATFNKKACSMTKCVTYADFEVMLLAMLQHSQWSALLARPEDRGELKETKERLQAAEAELINAKQRLLVAEEKAEALWLEDGAEERQATAERAIKKLRGKVGDLEQQRNELGQQVAVAEAAPSAGDQAAVIKQRVAELLPKLKEEEAREEFSRFLRSLEPSLQLIVNADSGELQLYVGGKSTGPMPMYAEAARKALEAGESGLTIHKTKDSEGDELLVEITEVIGGWVSEHKQDPINWLPLPEDAPARVAD